MLKNQLQKDQIKALKEGDKKRLEILRFILSRVKNKEIEKQKELSDEEFIEVLRKIEKELNESLEFAQKSKREDLVQNYKSQLEVVKSYLPKPLTDEELEREIEKIIEENKALWEKNPRAIIGIAVKKLKPVAEAGRIAKIVQNSKLKVKS